MNTTLAAALSGPSPTNPHETLGQSEDRVANTIEVEVAIDVAMGGDGDGVDESTKVEASTLASLDPSAADKFNAAVQDGIADGSLDDDFDDEE
jgi:hypothetical protein